MGTPRITDYIGKSYYTDKTKDPHRRDPKRTHILMNQSGFHM